MNAAIKKRIDYGNKNSTQWLATWFAKKSIRLASTPFSLKSCSWSPGGRMGNNLGGKINKMGIKLMCHCKTLITLYSNDPLIYVTIIKSIKRNKPTL